MRTTLNIDDDVLAAAKRLAELRTVSVGRVLSDLARRGLASAPEFDRRSETGFPMFKVPSGARALSIEEMHRVEEENVAILP